MQPAASPPPAPAPAPAPPSAPARRRLSLKFILVLILLLAAAFAGGYVPATMRARELAATLNTTQLDLRLANLHRLLGVASHEVQRNNYANAAAAARAFFDGCSALAQSGEAAALPRTQAAITAYASYRDDVMTHLANGDPQMKERLAGMYLAMDGVLARRQ